jgi:hypothetical protein
VKLTAPKGEQLYKPDVDHHRLGQKDVEPPVTYAGDVPKWRHWCQKLRRFSHAGDPRWPKLLDTPSNLEEICNKPITEDVEVAIFKGLTSTARCSGTSQGAVLRVTWRRTHGLAHGTFMAGGRRVYGGIQRSSATRDRASAKAPAKGVSRNDAP